jgi:hypothetical protein
MTTKEESIEMTPQPAVRNSEEDTVGRFSGEPHWDGRILATTTIEVEDYVGDSSSNSPEERRKYMPTSPLGRKFERDQEKRTGHHTVTIQGGVGCPKPSFRTSRSPPSDNGGSGQTVYEFLRGT